VKREKPQLVSVRAAALIKLVMAKLVLRSFDRCGRMLRSRYRGRPDFGFSQLILLIFSAAPTSARGAPATSIVDKNAALAALK